LSFVFVTTGIYAVVAGVARQAFNEKPTEISKYQMLTLSLTSIASTYTSVRSLRYVIYPVQILFKSCKPVPVMLFGVALGKKYPIRKYVNVAIITIGVALFMGGGNSTPNKSTTTMTADSTLIGAFMLSISLCFDGATGAYEDRLMGKDHVEPFDLMYNIQLGKAVISFCGLAILNGLPAFFETLDQGGIMLVLLGITGACGQVFVFLTISKFGALNCALIGLGRKLLSLLLSFILYGHHLNGFQAVGLTLSLAAMISNFVEKGGNKKEVVVVESVPHEELSLLAEGDMDEDGDVESDGIWKAKKRAGEVDDDIGEVSFVQKEVVVTPASADDLLEFEHDAPAPVTAV
jgi:UDP-galactose transporter B1